MSSGNTDVDRASKEVSEEERRRAYSIVFDELCKCPLFCGSYDARNGKEDYMYGISAVMENIAYGVSEECHDRFEERFLQNMTRCEFLAEKRIRRKRR